MFSQHSRKPTDANNTTNKSELEANTSKTGASKLRLVLLPDGYKRSASVSLTNHRNLKSGNNLRNV